MRTLAHQTSTGNAVFAVLALLAVAAAGCTGTAEDASPASPPPTADATAAPQPTSSVSPSPAPSPSPSTEPTPAAAAGPDEDADGCPPPREDRATLPEPASEVPSTSNDRISESPAGRPIEVGLVVLEGGPAAQQVTTAVRRAVQDVIAEWDRATGPPSEDDGTRPPPELQLQVTTTRLGTQLVSFRMEGYQYLGGAAGDALADGWTFATATGDQLDLAEVGLDGPCSDELGGLAADALQAQGIGMFEEAEEELRAGEIPMGRWSVTDELLQLHFPEYVVAPGAAGAPTAEIPLSEVHEVTGTPLGASGD